MSFFDQVYQSVFGSKSKQQNMTLAHETLTRSVDFQNAFDNWKKNEKLPEMLASIRGAYSLKQQGIEQNPEIHILKSKYANGLAISYGDFFGLPDFAFLLDLLAEKVKSLGYRTANEDVIIRNKAKVTETIEKRYLKPVHANTTPIDQKYGNVLLEFVKIDDNPSYFKLSANVYSDRLYSSPLPFDDLVQELF